MSWVKRQLSKTNTVSIQQVLCLLVVWNIFHLIVWSGFWCAINISDCFLNTVNPLAVSLFLKKIIVCNFNLLIDILKHVFSFVIISMNVLDCCRIESLCFILPHVISNKIKVGLFLVSHAFHFLSSELPFLLPEPFIAFFTFIKKRDLYSFTAINSTLYHKLLLIKHLKPIS